MTKRIFVDIETLPPDKSDSGGRIREEIFSCSDEDFRRLALDGDFGRVLTIGLIMEHDDQVIHRGLLGRERQTMMFHLDEARTLRAFWKLLKGFNPRRDLIVGHNLFDFDLPFLYKRSVIQRVRPTVELSFARYRSQPIFDTMHQWNKWSPRKYVSLDRLAKILGMESSKGEGIDGSRVYDKFCAGCHGEIADYCMRDVELVRDIYYRMSFTGEEDKQGGSEPMQDGRDRPGSGVI
jgi:DNA polymerase elongation subunit (family B)